MTLVVAILVIGLALLATGSNAYAQVSQNDSSSASSTVCMNSQPCHTLVCNENQPCYVSESPNIESQYEDYLDDIEDILDDYN